MTSGVIAGHRTRLHSVTPINQGSPHVESTARSHRCLRLIHGPDPTCAHGGWLFRHPRAPLQELGGCAGSCRFCDRVPARDGGEESSLGWGEDSIRTFERPSEWPTMFCPTCNTPAPRFHSNGKIWTIPEDPSPNTSLSGRSRPRTRPVPGAVEYDEWGRRARADGMSTARGHVPIVLRPDRLHACWAIE